MESGKKLLPGVKRVGTLNELSVNWRQKSVKNFFSSSSFWSFTFVSPLN